MKITKLVNKTLAGTALIAAAFGATPAIAAEVTLKLHQFLPPVATVPKLILKPWGEQLEEASGGRIKVEHYDSMSLGGRPPVLVDQVVDGAVDLTMTVLGYTPGRFPRSEVFDLPFMSADPVATSLAFWDLIDSDLKNNEFKNVKVLGAWVHGPGVIHTKKAINNFDDLNGAKIRAPSRLMNSYLKSMGAIPVGLPIPAIPEAMSKGVIDGTVIPWEVTPAVKLSELVGHHTEFSNSRESLYTTPIVLLMNKQRYDSLPADLKEAIDKVSGSTLSAMAAQVMLDRDAPARKIAKENGNSITILDSTEIERWKQASKPVVSNWVAEMAERKIDGQALIDTVSASIKSYEK